MEYLIGVGLALMVCAFAMVAGFDSRPRLLSDAADRDCHLLHFVCSHGKVHSGPGHRVRGGGHVFRAGAVAGFRKNLWLVVAALAGHGVFDFFHQLLIQNPGVPIWWPGFCLSFDILAGCFLAMLLMRRSRFALPP